MAPGTKHRIPRGGVLVTYVEFKLQPSEFNKSLKQIAREQLNNENRYVDILYMVRPVDNTGTWYAEIPQPKDRFDPNWTLLLPDVPKATPPTSDLGTFKVIQKTYVRKSPKVETGNINNETIIGTVYTYKKSSKFTDAGGLVWVDVTSTNLPNKVNGVTYWVCVREGNISHTDPLI